MAHYMELSTAHAGWSCDYVELSTAGWLIVMWLQLSHVTTAQHSRTEEIPTVVVHVLMHNTIDIWCFMDTTFNPLLYHVRAYEFSDVLLSVNWIENARCPLDTSVVDYVNFKLEGNS